MNQILSTQFDPTVTATVFNIQCFSVHDGPGIRTSVFLKGCPLDCLWCHNPESKRREPELFYDESKCIGCGECARVCECHRIVGNTDRAVNAGHNNSRDADPDRDAVVSHDCDVSTSRDRNLTAGHNRAVNAAPDRNANTDLAHTPPDRIHSFDRGGCKGCGRCADVCPAEALELCGRELTVGETLETVLRDRDFYGSEYGLTVRGGLTVTGGEPLYSFEFTYNLLRGAKASGLHTCVETSGCAPFERLRELAGVCDIFLYDYKETSPELHKKYTGVDNRQIVDNLLRLDSIGAVSILRCPIIPGLNDRPEHLAAIASLANRLTNIIEIDVEPYHPLGAAKCLRLGREYPMNREYSQSADTLPAPDAVTRWVDTIRAQTDVPVHY